MDKRDAGHRRSVHWGAVLLAVVALLAGRSLAAQNISITPPVPFASDHVVLQIFTLCYQPFIHPPTIEGQTITFRGDDIPPPPCPPPPAGGHFVTSFQLPQLPAGTYTVQGVTGPVVYFSTTLVILPAFVEAPTSTLLYFHQSRFVASVSWHTAKGTPTAAQAVPLSDGSGFFWFFDSENPELTVKVIDGTAVNGHFWVFVASSTDLAYTLTITDQSSTSCTHPPCSVKTYTAHAGHNQNVIDLKAFPSTP